MIILNNCTDCGRVPRLVGRLKDRHFHAECKCGKRIVSNYSVWSREVAADVWNRANPEEDGFEFNLEYINFLAGELARNGIRAFASAEGLKLYGVNALLSDDVSGLLRECSLHTQDLTEFYRKRLEPVA
jgi:hypothetical protein